MQIHDLSHLELLNRSSDIFGGVQPDDNGLLTLELGEDNTLSLKQGNILLFNTKLTNPPQGIIFSIPGNPNIALSSAALVTGGKATTALTLSFGTTPSGAIFTSATSWTATA